MIIAAYQLSKRFELDFWEIQDWLFWHESEVRSNKIIQSILEKLDYINQNPFATPATTKSDGIGGWIRKAVHFETYIILYIIHSDFVEFISIYHGKRNVL